VSLSLVNTVVKAIFTHAVAPGRIRKWGARLRAKCQDKILSCPPPPTFLALQVQLVVFVSAFVMVSTVWSVSCLLFFYSRCPLPRAQPFVKVGSTCPPCPTESAPPLFTPRQAGNSSECPVFAHDLDQPINWIECGGEGADDWPTVSYHFKIR